MFDKLTFVLGEALTAMRRNGFMTFAAITTAAVSLFLIGGASYAYIKAVQYADTIPGKFDMRVFLRSGTNPADISTTANAIRSIPGVDKVYWMPKDKVWELEKQRNPSLTEGIEDPLPDSFKVTISDLGKGDEIADRIGGLKSVDPNGGVQYLKDEQAAVDQGIRILKWLGVAVGGLLLLTSGVLIFNAIRLAVLARQLEIRIMRLVGASPATVFVPFILEGVAQGALGGLLASVLIFGAHRQLGLYLQTLTAQASLPPFPIWTAMLWLGITGALYGFVCSFLSLKTRYDHR
jgi:cell division transport system permease protein